MHSPVSLSSRSSWLNILLARSPVRSRLSTPERLWRRIVGVRLPTSQIVFSVALWSSHVGEVALNPPILLTGTSGEPFSLPTKWFPLPSDVHVVIEEGPVDEDAQQMGVVVKAENEGVLDEEEEHGDDETVEVTETKPRGSWFPWRT
jgi:hypothetical protein